LQYFKEINKDINDFSNALTNFQNSPYFNDYFKKIKSKIKILISYMNQEIYNLNLSRQFSTIFINPEFERAQTDM